MTMLLEESIVDEQPVASRQDLLETRVLLLSPTISYWRGQYQLPRSTTETVTEGMTVDHEDVTAPRAKLLTDKYPCDSSGKPWKKRFQTIESRLNSLKDRYSVPFPIQGVRIVPKKAGREMLSILYGLTYGQLCRKLEEARDRNDVDETVALEYIQNEALRQNGNFISPSTPVRDRTRNSENQSIAYDLHMAALEFCKNWTEIRAEIAAKNDVFKYVESRIPRAGSDMRSKFSLDVVPIELAGSSGNVVDADTLEEHNDIVREACKRRVNEAIESMVAGPRAQLASALASLQGLIARDGRVSSKSFAPVRAAIEKIRLFDFVANDDLLREITALENRLGGTSPQALDSTTAATSGFTEAIDAFMAEVQNEDKMAVDVEEFGRPTRALSFRKSTN